MAVALHGAATPTGNLLSPLHTFYFPSILGELWVCTSLLCFKGLFTLLLVCSHAAPRLHFPIAALVCNACSYSAAAKSLRCRPPLLYLADSILALLLAPLPPVQAHMQLLYGSGAANVDTRLVLSSCLPAQRLQPSLQARAITRARVRTDACSCGGLVVLYKGCQLFLARSRARVLMCRRTRSCALGAALLSFLMMDAFMFLALTT